MNKEKQIEEMAKALTKYEKTLCDRLPKDKCLLTSAIHAQVSCDYCKIAEFLYEQGYRKQSEGEWVEKYQILSYVEDDVDVYYECSVCGCNSHGQSPYCPNCGAKMKGD